MVFGFRNSGRQTYTEDMVGLKMECSVTFCKDFDFGSENSCWGGKYAKCGVRIAFEEGVLLIWDEQPIKYRDEVSVLRCIIGNR